MNRYVLAFLLALSGLRPAPLSAYDRRAWTCYPNMNYVTSLAEGEGGST